MNDDGGAILIFIAAILSLVGGPALVVTGLIACFGGHIEGGLICAGIGAALAAAGAKAWGLI